MEFMIQEAMEFDLCVHNLSHVIESSYAILDIDIKELLLEKDISDDAKLAIFEEKSNDFINKIKHGIDTIITAITDFINKSITKIKTSVQDRKAKETIKNIQSQQSKLDNKKVEVRLGEFAKKELDIYIREVTKLERKLMNIKFTSKFGGNQTVAIVECNKIARELEKLDELFDKKLLQENEYIIQMAKKDAIRYCDKELDNISVDYNAVEKNSKEVLMLIKKDLDGCEVPVKANILQKMTRSISTRVRQTTQKMTECKHKNIYVVAAIGAIIAAGKVALTNPRVKEKVGKGLEYAKSGQLVEDINKYTKKLADENAAMKAAGKS